jgi:hypothetical protein
MTSTATAPTPSSSSSSSSVPPSPINRPSTHPLLLPHHQQHHRLLDSSSHVFPVLFHAFVVLRFFPPHFNQMLLDSLLFFRSLFRFPSLRLCPSFDLSLCLLTSESLQPKSSRNVSVLSLLIWLISFKTIRSFAPHSSNATVSLSLSLFGISPLPNLSQSNARSSLPLQ